MEQGEAAATEIAHETLELCETRVGQWIARPNFSTVGGCGISGGPRPSHSTGRVEAELDALLGVLGGVFASCPAHAHLASSHLANTGNHFRSTFSSSMGPDARENRVCLGNRTAA